MLADVSSTTRMRPWCGENSSACMARHCLVELRSRLVKGKGLDALLELGKRLGRKTPTDELTVGLEMINRRGVPIRQVPTQLVNRLLDSLRIVALGDCGSRWSVVAMLR